VDPWAWGWEAVGALGTTIAVLVATLAIGIQTRWVRRTLGSQTYQLLLAQFDGILDWMRSTPGLYHAVFIDEATDLTRTGPDRELVNLAMARLFDWYESVAVQHQHYKVLPDAIASHWGQLLSQDLQRKPIRHYWIMNRQYYQPILQRWVDDLRQQSGP